MAEITKYDPGTFCWTELSSGDAAAAKKFYLSLFNWKANDVPIGEGMTYTMLMADGKEACALYQSEDVKGGKVPTNWLAFISVANADDLAKKAKAAGGKVIDEPFDVMDVGRMVVIQDPTGGVFAGWQPRKHIGARATEIPGSVCWRELMTSNVDVAGKFYATVFGWKPEGQKMPGMDYYVFKNKDDMVGGMMTTPVKGIPTHWLTYWIVENCEKSLQKAKQLGAEILKGATKIPDIGTFAVLKDPQGAPFAIMQGEE